MTGGYFSSSKNYTLRQRFNFISRQFQIPYNIYIIHDKRNQETLVLEMYIKPQILFLKELNNDLSELEQLIKNTCPISYTLKILYKDIKDKPKYV